MPHRFEGARDLTHRSIYWYALIATIALDQATKFWTRSSLVLNQSADFPWPRIFEFTRVENEGIAFGMLQGFGALLAPVAVVIAFGAWLYSHRHPKESSWTHLAMGLLSGGAIGNLIDRLVLGKVTDMFSFRLIEFPVFNVADSCISIAGAILVLRWTFEIAQSKSEEKDAAQAERPSAQGIGETVSTDVK